jgi:uncharacterized protein involved in oxidation of intracellular sulfur
VKVLLVINGAAYGSDATFNAIRLAGVLGKRDGVAVRVFLMGDGVTCAVAGQSVPNGYYHLDRMLTGIIGHGGEVACCGTCMDARGIREEMLIDKAQRSTMEHLADWTLDADKVLVF